MLSKQHRTKLNPMLLNVLLISGGLHVVALLVLGGITIVKFVIPDEAQFEEPPAVVEEQPPPEVKIEIKQQPPQQNNMNQLRLKQIGNIAVEAVDVNLPNMGDSFTVSAGLGGFGGGSLLGGARGNLGIGMSDVSVFGLKTRAERILFLIDGSRFMLIDEKGGLNSYKVIKDEITTMVGNLSAGTLFNVAFYDQRVNFFQPQLVPAGAEITKDLQNWIAPINADPSNVGIHSGEGVSISALPEEPVHKSITNMHARTHRNARLTQMAMETSVDAIFIITGEHNGFTRTARQPTEKELQEWEAIVNSAQYQEQLRIHREEYPEMRKRVASRLAAINRERAAKGQPPRILKAGAENVRSNAFELGLEFKTEHPGSRPPRFHELREITNYFKKLVKLLYTDKGGRNPSVNVVLFLAGDENLSEQDEDTLKDYVRFFDGKHRVIRGANEIRQARSAGETVNQ